MSPSPPPPDPGFAARAAGFPRARQGYSRGHVDEFVADAQRYVDRLRQENAALTADVSRLTEQLSETEAKYERIRTADLDERAQDILAAAEEQARAIVAEGKRVAAESVQQARREAEVIFERGRQELAWRRRRFAAEHTELERQLKSAQYATVSAPSVDPSLSEIGLPAAPDSSSTAEGEAAREAPAAPQPPV